MTEPMDVRRRRAHYRAAHRGTKELDILIGRFAEAQLDTFDDQGLTTFERFLAVADPLLQGWIFAQTPVEGSEFEDLVSAIRAFHGLDRDDGADGAAHPHVKDENGPTR